MQSLHRLPAITRDLVQPELLRPGAVWYLRQRGKRHHNWSQSVEPGQLADQGLESVEHLRAVQSSVPRGSIQHPESSVVPEPERNRIQCKPGYGESFDSNFWRFAERKRRPNHGD